MLIDFYDQDPTNMTRSKSLIYFLPPTVSSNIEQATHLQGRIDDSMSKHAKSSGFSGLPHQRTEESLFW
jgi:hypothetical protein